MEDSTRRIAKQLRRQRTRRGWSQQETAARAGLNLRHYQKLESAEVSMTVRTLDQLAHAFSLDVRTLFG